MQKQCYNRLSQFYIPKPTKKSANDGFSLLQQAGFIKATNNAGFFHYLPLGLRVLENLSKWASDSMESIGASKISLGSLSSASLWKESGRFGPMKNELFTLDNDKLLLAPTHEEEVTLLVKSQVHSHRQLPVKVFQIGNKYRNELRPRHGLLRSREFLMKDMYTFDTTAEASAETFTKVFNAYCTMFDQLGIPYHVVDGDNGGMGGKHSQEFHYPLTIGDNTLSLSNGKWAYAGELTNEGVKTTEVGHLFSLGTTYTESFNFKIDHQPVHMNCFGIGLSRMLGAIAEISRDENGFMWPERIAPFKAVVVFAGTTCPNLPFLPNNVAVDDRDLSLSWKLRDADLFGIPLKVIFGNKGEAGVVEMKARDGQSYWLTETEMFEQLAK